MSSHHTPAHTGAAHAHAVAHAPLFGVMGEYADEHAVVEAAKSLYALGYRKMDGYSPIPVEGLSEAMGRKRTRLPILVLAGGLSGAFLGLGMQVFANAVHYPMNVAGRPYVSWPLFIPITFECTILLASFAAVFGMLGINGLPQPYHPTFNVPAFVRASANGFFLCVEATDPTFDVANLKEAFETTGAKAVYEVPE
jgi:hypothetical protein